MKKITLFILGLIFSLTQGFSQLRVNDTKSLWVKKTESQLSKEDKVHRSSFPKEFQLYQLNIEALKNQLVNAPMRGEVLAKYSSLKIKFPNAKGEFETFAIVETPLMEGELANKMSMIKSYAGQGIEDPSATIRFSVTQLGLHTMILSGTKRSWFIDPYTEDRQNYIVYTKESLGFDSQSFECLTEQGVYLPSLKSNVASENNAVDDNKLRTYRLALSCTGEYGTIFKGTGTTAQQKANVQAQMAITMTRVNGVYERDLATTMVFIANNDAIIYLNAGTDPWTNEWNTKTAQTIDSNIGIANYDIGHNFNTTGGGNAGCLGCVCLGSATAFSQSGTHKGRGYTGRPDPTGDPFDIDYVAHEMGHQFNGYHTMNTCSRSGSGATEVEPASGSTIMGYAGICNSNIQANSDAYFNYVNIRDISANIKTGNSSTCDVETSIGNAAPTADAGNDYIIPISTPYMLIGSSTDEDGTASHTFTWEQNDPEQAPNGEAPPAATSTVGPMVRSFEGTTNPIRYIPRLSDLVVTGGSTTWEVLPSVTRNMEFALTVRDNNAAGGQTADDLMTVSTTTTAGPFVVTSQSSNVIWPQGSTQTVTWNVAGTNTGSVNTPNVDILLSKDGGLTYPFVLATATPNDGSHDIVVPNGEASNCRVMVKGNGNIFFNINSANININGAVNPVVSFTNVSDAVVEGSDCDFTDVTVDIDIAVGASQNTTANISVAGGTASSQDFILLTSSVNFSAGATGTQPVTIRVFNDDFVEGDETVDLTFAVNANGGDATAGNNTYTLTINDDDVVPAASQVITLLDSDMETSDTTNWSVIDNDGDGNIYLSVNAGGGAFYPGIDGVFLGSESNGGTLGTGGNFTPDNFLLSDAIAIPAGASTVSLSYGIGGYLDSEPYEVYWTTNNSNVANITAGSLIDSGNTLDSNGQVVSLDLSAFAGQTGYLVFRHISPGTNVGNGRTDGLLLLDNVLMEATVSNSIQTAVNTGVSNELANLSRSGTIYAADAVTSDFILDLTNNNNDNFGCVDISVSRAGTSAQSYNGSSTPNFVTDKTFTITPTVGLSSSNTTIDFYFTDAEILGYEATTGQSRTSMSIIRDNGSTTEVVPVTITAFGSDHKVSGTFTSGIDGTYYFGVPAALSTSEFAFDQFSVYPNPTNGEVSIALSTSEDVNISVFDIRGRQIFNNLYSNNNSIFNKTINLDTSSTGIYILKVKAGNKSAFKRIIVK